MPVSTAPPPYDEKARIGYFPIKTMIDVVNDKHKAMRTRCKVAANLAKMLDVQITPRPFWGKMAWLTTVLALIEIKGKGLNDVIEFRNHVKAYAADETRYHTFGSSVLTMPRTAEMCASYMSPCKSKNTSTRIGHGVVAACKWVYGDEFAATCNCAYHD